LTLVLNRESYFIKFPVLLPKIDSSMQGLCSRRTLCLICFTNIVHMYYCFCAVKQRKVK